MAKEDYTAALQALSILADTATSFKKMEFASDESERAFNRQQQAQEDAFNRQQKAAKDQMFLQNSLALERDAYNEYNSLVNEIKEYGLTYNDLDSANAQQILKDISSPKVRKAGEIKQNFQNLQAINMQLASRISKQKKIDLDLTKEREKEVFEAGQDEFQMKQIEFLTKQRKENPILTGVAYTDPSDESKAYLSQFAKDGINIMQTYSNMSSSALGSIAQSQLIDYVDMAPDEMDYSDEQALKMYIKEEAKEYALDNYLFESFGVNPDDIDSAGTDSPTDAYKRFEKRYVDAAMKGIKANPNYVFKSQKSIDDTNAQKIITAKQVHSELFASLNNAHKEMIGKFGMLGEDGTFTITMSEDRKKGVAKEVGVEPEQLDVLITQLATSVDDPVRAKELIQRNKLIRKLLVNTTGGADYMNYLERLIKRIDLKVGETKPVIRMNKGNDIARRLING